MMIYTLKYNDMRNGMLVMILYGLVYWVGLWGFAWSLHFFTRLGFMDNCLAFVMLKCALIHVYCHYKLDDSITWLGIQLHDMHVYFTRFDVVGLLMYILMT